jgi:Mitochondrial pyruvate carriers
VTYIVAVHFWAPTFKWGISIANIADFSKPPEKISYPQQIGMFSYYFQIAHGYQFVYAKP